MCILYTVLHTIRCCPNTDNHYHTVLKNFGSLSLKKSPTPAFTECDIHPSIEVELQSTDTSPQFESVQMHAASLRQGRPTHRRSRLADWHAHFSSVNVANSAGRVARALRQARTMLGQSGRSVLQSRGERREAMKGEQEARGE